MYSEVTPYMRSSVHSATCKVVLTLDYSLLLIAELVYTDFSFICPEKIQNRKEYIQIFQCKRKKSGFHLYANISNKVVSVAISFTADQI